MSGNNFSAASISSDFSKEQEKQKLRLNRRTIQFCFEMNFLIGTRIKIKLL